MGNLCCGCFGSKPRTISPPPTTSEKQDPVEELYSRAAVAWALSSDSPDPNIRANALAEATRLYQEALDVTRVVHSRRKDILYGLSFALLEQCEEDPTRTSLATVEDCFVEIKKIGPAAVPTQFGYAITTKAGYGYRHLYKHTPASTDSTHDFDHYVSNLREALGYSDPENQTQIYLELAFEHYQQLGVDTRIRLQNALDLYESAKSTCPEEKADLRLKASKAIYTVHLERYWSDGSPGDLEKAIAECKEQLGYTSLTGRANSLVDLAHSIWILTESHSIESDHTNQVKEGVGYCREALELLGDGGSEEMTSLRIRASILLANTLSSRHGKPNVKDIDEAISLYRKVMDGEGNGDAELLSHLAGAIWFRCETDEEQGDKNITLQAAVDTYTEALKLSDDHKLNSSIANNIGAIYVEKSGKKDKEYLGLARLSYLNAAEWCDDENDKEYYKGQAEILEQHVVKVGSKPTRTLTPRRQSTVREGTR